jgi:hypothetical protein
MNRVTPTVDVAEDVCADSELCKRTISENSEEKVMKRKCTAR